MLVVVVVVLLEAPSAELCDELVVVVCTTGDEDST